MRADVLVIIPTSVDPESKSPSLQQAVEMIRTFKPRRICINSPTDAERHLVGPKEHQPRARTLAWKSILRDELAQFQGEVGFCQHLPFNYVGFGLADMAPRLERGFSHEGYAATGEPDIDKYVGLIEHLSEPQRLKRRDTLLVLARQRSDIDKYLGASNDLPTSEEILKRQVLDNGFVPTSPVDASVADKQPPATTLQGRIFEVKNAGIDQVLALRGWPFSYKIENPVKDRFKDTLEWIRYLRVQFSGPGGVSATCYPEGQLHFREELKGSDLEDPNVAGSFQSVSNYYVVQSTPFGRRVLLKDPVQLGLSNKVSERNVQFDLEKIKAGASVLLANRVLDLDSFFNYRHRLLDQLEKANAGNTAKLEVEIGAQIDMFDGKFHFFKSSEWLSFVYASVDLKNEVFFHRDGPQFQPGDRVKVACVIEGDSVLYENTLVQCEGTIVCISGKDAQQNPTFTVQYNDQEESDVSMARISNEAVDTYIKNLFLCRTLQMLRTMAEQRVAFVEFVVKSKPQSFQSNMSLMKLWEKALQEKILTFDEGKAKKRETAQESKVTGDQGAHGSQ